MSIEKQNIAHQDNLIFKELVSILGNGFILSLFTIDFFCFEYVLPILGSFIMLYGCHLAKEVNTYFKRTYYIASARSILMLINFLIDWTIYHNNLVVTYIQIAFSATLIVLLFYNLNLAFKAIYASANITPYNNRLAQYITLYLCSISTTYLTVHLGILGALLSLFILILNILFLMLTFLQIGKMLSTVDIEITVTHYTKEETKRTISCLILYGIILCVTVFFSNKAIFLPFSISKTLSEKQSSIEEAEKKLLDLDIPTDVLNDLPSSEIEYLLQATSIQSSKSIRTANNGSLEITLYEVDCSDYYRVIVHYKWLTPPSNRLYQILECQFNNEMPAEDITGLSVFTDEENNNILETPNLSIGLNNACYPYVQHKLSNDGDDLRGYLAFSYRTEPKKKPTKFTVNCYYQVSVFNLPYLNIIDYMNEYKNHTNSFVFDRLNIPLTVN